MDAAVLDVTERLCHRFQVWTGRTNVWLAFQLTNLSIVVYFVWALVLYWSSANLGMRLFVATFCSGVFFILTRTLFKSSVDLAEAEAYRRVARGLRNPRRLRDAQLRIAFLSLSLILSFPLYLAYRYLPDVRFVIYAEALILLTTMVLYLLACDPLPPCTGKVTAWLRTLVPARQATPIPETESST